MYRVVLLLSVVAVIVVAQDGCTGAPNTIPVHTDAPTFVSKVAGGSKYVTGPADMEPKLNVIHVYGTPYQMGQAYGQLMHDEINTLVPQVFDYIYAQIGDALKDLPPAVRKAVEELGADAALDLWVDFTKDHIPVHYTQLFDGMANGTGLAAKDLLKISLFPEIIKMSCSMFGAWGSATADVDLGLVQLRALDWSTDGPFQQFPLLIVYHPAAGFGNTFATLSWAGLMGSITGMSDAGIGVSEKVWLHYDGPYSPIGKPTTFVLQDILNFAMDTDQALSQIASANRTASIFVGIGDKFNNQFKAVEYSHTVVNVYNPRNFPIYENHDRFDDLVFIDKHTQPSKDPCLNSLMHKYYGSLSPENTLQYVTPVLQTGNMHVAVYDFARGFMFVANASPVSANGTVVNAYDRPFIRVNTTALFAQPHP